jgi:DNA-binding NtrC family response regulator
MDRKGDVMNWPVKVLIVAPESPDRDRLQKIFSDSGAKSACCSTLLEARTILSGHLFFSAVFCQDPLPGGDLQTLLADVARYQNGVPVVALSLQADWDAYLRAMYAGAYDCLALPPAPLEAQRVLRSAIREFSTVRTGEAVAA